MSSTVELLRVAFTLENFLLTLFVLLLLNRLQELYDFRGMPPGPRLYSIPIIGNLLSWRMVKSSLRENTEWFRKVYGPIFSLKLGSWKTVVAGNQEAIKEILVTKSTDFAGRPQLRSFMELTFGCKDVAFANYGSAWRLHRKVFVTALRQHLSDGPLIGRMINKQILGVLNSFDKQKEESFDPMLIITTAVNNVISVITFGEGFDNDHPDIRELFAADQRNLKDFDMQKMNEFLDYFPAFNKLPFKSYLRLRKDVTNIYRPIRKMLREAEAEFQHGKPPRTLVSWLLKTKMEMKLKAENGCEDEAIMAEEYMLGTLFDMFSAGYESTSTTTLWAIVYLLNYPQYQLDIQEEMDRVIGRGRLPTLDDQPKLPLLQAAIMEAQRLGNVNDTAIHMALKDTTICGYRVPKDTVVFPDLHSLHLDPKCWSNPEDFNPYRHIDFEGRLVSDQENWLPFSAGRRGCPGYPLAKTQLFMFLSAILQRFTLLPEDSNCLPTVAGSRGATRYPHRFKMRLQKRK